MSTKNEEKAHAMLNRWVAIKKELNSRSKEKRPKYSTECNNLQDCERWRNQIIKEITKKVADIQNASLGEYRIREMNDDINKLFREKGHWEDRIKELGGADYKKLAPKTVDAEGYEIPNSGGYKYWGAAKDLPGVRELFNVEAPTAPRKNIVEMYRGISIDYYQWDNLEDQIFTEETEQEEQRLKDELVQSSDFPMKKRKVDGDNDVNIIEEEGLSGEELEKFRIIHSGFIGDMKNSKRELTPEEIEKDLIEKKKSQLLKMLQESK